MAEIGSIKSNSQKSLFENPQGLNSLIPQATDLFMSGVADLKIEEGCIYVNVKSLNHAYTKASLRLEPNRRGHGGRVYDHVAYKTDKGYIPLETLRNEFEEKMWNNLLNK